MPLSTKEQKRFEEMLNDSMVEKNDPEFLTALSDVLFEMTGSVNLKMRLLILADWIDALKYKR